MAYETEKPASRNPHSLWAVLIRPGLAGYTLAIVGAALACALRYLLAPILGNEAPYLFFTPAVLVAAWAGGFGPGLLAVILSELLLLFLITGPAASQPEMVN